MKTEGRCIRSLIELRRQIYNGDSRNPGEEQSEWKDGYLAALNDLERLITPRKKG
jgi:hypothetical protein